MIADDIVVILEVLQHLFVAAFGMAEPEAVLYLDGIAGPVQGSGLTKQRATAAIEQAADDLVLRVIVGGARVLVEVEAGEAADTLAEGPIVRVGQALDVEGRQPLAVVQPVEHDREFLVVHAVAGERDILSLGGGVLPEVSFPGLLVQLQDRIRGAESMQDGPVGAVLDGIVGTVVASPAFDAHQVPALVEVALKELLARCAVRAKQLAFEKRPCRRRHRRCRRERDLLGWERAGKGKKGDGCKHHSKRKGTIHDILASGEAWRHSPEDLGNPRKNGQDGCTTGTDTKGDEHQHSIVPNRLEHPLPKATTMKKLINRPQDVVEEMVEGLAAAYPGLRRLPGQTVLIRSDLPVAAER